MEWTQERIETLRVLWTTGLSAGLIATQLGSVSRNAVLGKIWRLGLARARRAPSLQIKAARARRSPRNLPVTAMRRQPSAVRPALLLPPPSVAEPEAGADVPDQPLVPLLALEDGMCRWPFGDPKRGEFGFCGREQIPGFSYCACHVRKAMQPAKPRRR